MDLLIKADNTRASLQPDVEDKTYSLEKLKELVGGYVEAVKIPGTKYLLLVNEDGRLKGLHINPAASSLADQVIVGDAVVCSPDRLN